MNNQGKFLWLIIYFTLVSLMAAGYVMAQEKSFPASPPPITEKISGFSGGPVADKPPTDPPVKVNHDQALSGGGITKGSINILSPAHVSNAEIQGVQQAGTAINTSVPTRTIKKILKQDVSSQDGAKPTKKSSIKVLSPARVSNKKFQADTTLPVLLRPKHKLEKKGISSSDD